MAWRCTGRTNAELVSNLSRAGLITSSRVQAAMAAVDRAHYCPSLSSPYEDSPQQIGHGATISAPHMHASAAESLLSYLYPGARVLDVGSGSGYLTHVLANLVAGDGKGDEDGGSSGSGGGGKVVGIDHITPLAELARANIQKSAAGKALLDSGAVEFIVGDGRKGWPRDGPYDAIHVGAAAVELHAELVAQLKAPGRLFIPVEDTGSYGGGWGGGGQHIWVVDKDANGTVKKTRTMGVRYVPLTDLPR